MTKAQLENSTDCRHTYLTYREIDRPGPHPADFADLSKDGGMLAPKTLEDQLATQPPPPPPVIPGYTPASTNNPAAKMTGTNAPTLLGAKVDPAADTRKVKYWITMSLPTYWTAPPPDAKPDEIYLYRPDFYQDQDGIARRITLWFNPRERSSLTDLLGQTTPGAKSKSSATAATPASPAVPVSPESDQAHNPFRSPFEDAFHSGGANHSTNASSKNPVPSGTNAAPTNVPTGLSQ